MQIKYNSVKLKFKKNNLVINAMLVNQFLLVN